MHHLVQTPAGAGAIGTNAEDGAEPLLGRGAPGGGCVGFLVAPGDVLCGGGSGRSTGTEGSRGIRSSSGMTLLLSVTPEERCACSARKCAEYMGFEGSACTAFSTAATAS